MNSDNRTWVTFTYFSSLVYKVTNLFRNACVNIAFKTTNTVLHQLQPRKTIDASKTSGIYRLLCNTCNRSYVGQCGRTIAVCYKEHIRYIRPNDPASAYALHILNQQHEYGCLNETLQFLKTCNKGNLMNQWETFYIQQLSHMGKLVSEQQPLEPNLQYALGSVPVQSSSLYSTPVCTFRRTSCGKFLTSFIFLHFYHLVFYAINSFCSYWP
jgi:hypothetical protein